MSFVIALFLMQFLNIAAVAVIENILAVQDIALTEAQLTQAGDWVFHLSLIVSVLFFIALFLFLLSERLSYIRDIIQGVDALRIGKAEYTVPVEMNNELTRLAEAVNYLSATQQKIKEKERALAEEKEQLIRALSHDIRTPLTSILSYSEYLANHQNCPPEKRQEQLIMIQKKAEQIRDLTDILLDGGKRNPEQFDDARLLMEQLAAEFEEMLENDFRVAVHFADCQSFAGTFDVQELRRIFDNLASNVQKYADPAHPVCLTIHTADHCLILRQTNTVCPQKENTQSHRMGLNSIRRIAHSYAGQVEVRQDNRTFEITITLSDF